MLEFAEKIFVQPWNDAVAIYWPMVLQGVLVSGALGLLGCFLVVRGLSLLGDALSHAILPGIALGFLIPAYFGHGSLHSPWIPVGATAMGLAASILVETVQRQSRVKEDASLGIVFTTLFALGVILISRYGGQADLDQNCVLYGNIESFIVLDGRVPDEVRPMIVIFALVVIGIVLFYRPLLVSTFDPGLALSVGIAAWAVHYALMTALSLTIVASFEAVGAILAVAFLILPGATARLWTQKLNHMLWFSVGFAVVTAPLGYWLSHPSILNTSAGAAMVMGGFGLFLVSWLLAPRDGLISRWLVRRRLRRTIEVENLIKTIAEIVESEASGVEGETPSVEGEAPNVEGETPSVEDEAPAEPKVQRCDPANGSAGASPSAVSVSHLQRELKWSAEQLDAVASRAVDRGWITRNGHLLRLTHAGIERGRRLEAAHVAWEAYLQKQLGLPADHVHDAAEWIEHYLEDAGVVDLEPARRG